MSIQFSCPNGHLLRVKESFAGKKALCPACKAPIQVPVPAAKTLEDEVLGILGPYDPGRYRNPAAVTISELLQPSDEVEASDEGEESHSPPHKSCNRCHREISTATHICPHCHTYIAGLVDF